MRKGLSGVRDGRGRPNWVLAGLLAVSLVFHAWILGHIAGLYESKALTYLEVGFEEKKNPAARSIPRPPERKRPPETERPQVAQASPIPVKAVQPPPQQAPAMAQKALVEPIDVPDRPDVKMPEAFSWAQPSAAAPAGPSPHGAAEDYFSMVRMKIESRKRYPPAAMKMQMHGRVSVRFSIEADGAVSGLQVIVPSRYQLLNEAALDAVKAASPFPRPPSRLFSGPVHVEISIVFELM
jgi:protein TonB